MSDIHKLKKKQYKKLMSRYGKLSLVVNKQGPFTLMRETMQKEMNDIRASILRHHGRYELESPINAKARPESTNVARFQVYYRNWKHEQMVKLGMAEEKQIAA